MAANPTFRQRLGRVVARLARQIGGGRGRAGYAGAAGGRLLNDWVFAATRSADKDIHGDLARLRARARELARNNAFGARIADAFPEQMLGESGIVLQAKNVTSRDTQNERANEAVEAAWKAWGSRGNCTTDRALSWYEVEELAARTFAVEGEFFALLIEGDPTLPHWFALQIVDPDQLDASYDVERTERGTSIRGGVEVDPRGRVIAYHLWERHPSDSLPAGNRRVAIPADRVLHLFHAKRPQQRRGVPFMAPVLVVLQHEGGYTEAEVVAARTAAAKMAFITTDGQTGLDLDSEGADAAHVATMEAEPGLISRLAPGEKVESWDPTHPTTAFRDFVTALTHQVAAAVGISHLTLTGNLAEANYSSMRAGMLNERRYIARLQQLLITHVHERVFAHWLRWALTAGQIPGFGLQDYDRLLAHRWQKPGWAWSDPEKEMIGESMELALGITSRTRIAAERGRDFAEVAEEIVRDNALLDTLGLELPEPGLPNTSTMAPAPADAAPPARTLRAIGGR